MARLLLPLLALLLWVSPPAWASDAPAALDRLAALPIQEGGRVMPLDAYARRLAVQVTGREWWSATRGPEGFADRNPMQLLCDLTFNGQAFLQKRIVAIENRPFKKAVGLEEERRFFTPVEIASNEGINDLLKAYSATREKDPKYTGSKNERKAIDVRNAVERVASFADGEPLAVVPGAPGKSFLHASSVRADPGAEGVRDAMATFAQAYNTGLPLDAPTDALIGAIGAVGQLPASDARSVRLELFYDKLSPWVKTAVCYGLAVVLFGVSRLVLRRPLTILAVAAGIVGVLGHLTGIGLRVAILGRAPVSNTYEALLWMGLVGIAIGLVAQLINRKAWYIFAGVAAALLSVIFASLVPLEDQTNSLPAVLRSNYWLTIHVLTIVASYGVLAVASVLGHAYLGSQVLFARGINRPAIAPKRSHPLIVQTYRTIQVGLFLLTAGTILGGVWAADSWGRFWGWDPKETWALISILTYFAVLHARYVRWLLDFGMAACAILGFVVIVWTFYGVNYVMATGLHSYGFGAGGEVYVGIWALIELVFLVACRVRYGMLRKAGVMAAPNGTVVAQASAGT
jgi:cytochrome c-type biogenesis protein CcsB